MQRLLAPVALTLAALLAGTSAHAAKKTQPHARNWATINVCRAPQLGVRGQMAGDGSGERMYMRFTTQYRAAHGWRRIGGRGRSPWLYAGPARLRSQQVGYTFTITGLRRDRAFLLRGVVELQWRNGSRVVRRGHLVTEAGHPGTTGARPRSYSAAHCSLRAPRGRGVKASAGAAFPSAE